MAATARVIWLCACVRYWPYRRISLAKNVVHMRCAKNHVSGFQRCNWFRSENARQKKKFREIETRFVLVIKWIIFCRQFSILGQFNKCCQSVYFSAVDVGRCCIARKNVTEKVSDLNVFAWCKSHATRSKKKL